MWGVPVNKIPDLTLCDGFRLDVNLRFGVLVIIHSATFLILTLNMFGVLWGAIIFTL